MELHDGTLDDVELCWSSGEAILRIRTGDTSNPYRTITATHVRRVFCERQMPWGFSISINEVRGPIPICDNSSAIEIKMQSGDVIRIEACEFSLRSTTTTSSSHAGDDGQAL